MATTTLDISDDYEVWDNYRTVTVWPCPRDDSISFPVERALRFQLDRRDLIQDNGAYTAEDRVWVFPAATSQENWPHDFSIRRGYVIEDQDDGTEWTVLQASCGAWGQKWRCVTRNLVLLADLRDTISVIRPAITVGDGAEPVFDWQNATTVVSGLAAKVKPTNAVIEDHNEATGTTRNFLIVLGQAVEFQEHDRIQWGGRVLQWMETTNEGRLDELQTVRAWE